ncbi:asparagine synthase-domain-containing protein [Xylariaceae sp. FL0016]|nr:asparagine synthase-domain-containing protein [Xylariaceae sp. FL0016]
MCGIHASVTRSGSVKLSPDLKQFLIDRGPDHLGQVHREVRGTATTSAALQLGFTSTVLALRGDHVARQPLESQRSASVLCWNGEAWKIGGELVDGNDGEVIVSKLPAEEPRLPDIQENQILDLLRSIEGPFALVYFDAPTNRLYYGRDRLGRRSLLQFFGGTNAMQLASVADVPTDEWEEVQADGIYVMNLGDIPKQEDTNNLRCYITRHDWIPNAAPGLLSNIGFLNAALPQKDYRLDFDCISLGILRRRLEESLKLRVLNVPEPPNSTSAVDIRIAILFSGGLDCSILARLCHDLLPLSQGIDLINVAFENPRQVALAKAQPHLRAADSYEACPDRATGRQSFAELKTTCPGRLWRFIAVNVPFEEAMSHKPKISSLIHPHNTEMDLSIAFALYFAARGIGDCYIGSTEWEPEPRVAPTPARVLLSGLGADELFGGYARHEVAFKRDNYRGLVEELRLDVGRIGQRNLGRDDRTMAHWGREVRFPYLDEEFVRFAIETPVWEKCDFQNPFHPAVIEPAKRLLRLLADQLGLPKAARLKKKAIQFGSRTAKIESATGRLRGTATITASIPANH